MRLNEVTDAPRRKPYAKNDRYVKSLALRAAHFTHKFEDLYQDMTWLAQETLLMRGVSFTVTLLYPNPTIWRMAMQAPEHFETHPCWARNTSYCKQLWNRMCNDYAIPTVINDSSGTRLAIAILGEIDVWKDYPKKKELLAVWIHLAKLHNDLCDHYRLAR